MALNSEFQCRLSGVGSVCVCVMCSVCVLCLKTTDLEESEGCNFCWMHGLWDGQGDHLCGLYLGTKSIKCMPPNSVL